MKRLKQLRSLPAGAKAVSGTSYATKAGTTIERYALNDRIFEVISYRQTVREVYEVVTDA